METYRADVVIVGAGIAGITAAFELLGQGRKVLLLDRDIRSEMGGLAKKTGDHAGAARSCKDAAAAYAAAYGADDKRAVEAAKRARGLWDEADLVDGTISGRRCLASA